MNELSYSLGVSMAFNLKGQGINIENKADFLKGMEAVLTESELAIPEEKIGEIINAYFTELQEQSFAEVKNAGKLFLEENAKKAGVVTLPSGLQYEIITEGKGEKPGLTDVVTTHYHGTLIDGNIFDSSVHRGQPASFPVNGVIKGWTEALQLMAVGSKWKLYVPYQLAYGEQGAGQAIGPYTTLIFEVELLEIQK
ncbi:MAG: FKBP-type peptidyl-prolyl cis-trans isomerase [Bacteroidetes bacterium]|nr:FKBP-type peptidyl-prolyl cis-trans isomerase [Bacteroidota bacterium]